MNKMLFFIQILVFIEIGLIILIVLLNAAARLYIALNAQYQKKQREKIESLLTQCSQISHVLTANQARYLRRHITLLLAVLVEFEKKELPFWQKLRQQISDKALKPKSRRLSRSRNWFKRYLAVNGFLYGFDPIDESLLLRLIADQALLVSLNASRVALKTPTEFLMNAIISVYSKGRRLQQDSFVKILSQDTPDLMKDIIAQRLATDFNPYVRIFCYRLLSNVSAFYLKSVTQGDMQSDNVDLKIAVLNYLAHVKQPEEIRIYLTDASWQVRAIAAKLSGQLKDATAIAPLETCLRDAEWWVRVNAANALGNLGDEGLAVLEKQDPSQDRYAYEAAQQVLKLIDR